MRRLPGHALQLAILVLVGCSRPTTNGGGSPSASAPSRPVFHEVEGLRWGMTPAEVISAWGPGENGDANEYTNKAGYSRASLDFARLPASDLIHTDLPPGSGDLVRLLTSVSLGSSDVLPKQKVRAAHSSRFGEPITDPKLLRNVGVSNCTGPRCEVFRAAECTLAVVQWSPASAELNRPETLDSLMYQLAPSSLVDYVPRSEWSRLKAPVPTSFSAERETGLGAMRMGFDGARPEEVETLLGSPNLLLEESPGGGKRYHLYLDGSVQVLQFQNGRTQGVTGLSAR